MKTQFLTIAAALLLVGIGTATVSCNKCGSKTTETTTVTTTATESADSTDTDIGNGQEGTGNGQASEKSGAVTGSKSAATGTATKTNTKGTKNGKSLDGYSAPDGTDAENHDGDQYTKNDNKPMPTGPPIK